MNFWRATRSFTPDCSIHRKTLHSAPMKSVRLIAVWLLMLALPLQGLAAFTPSTWCADAHSGETAHAAIDGMQNHHTAAVQAHDHPADYPQHDDGQPDQAGNHNCSHHVFTGMPVTVVPGIPAPPHAIVPRVSLLTTLHIPELPLRPPQV